MVLQAEVFTPGLVQPINIRDVAGQTQGVTTVFLAPPVATHLSLGLFDGQMSVTQVNAGYCFRNQLLPDTAQSLADDLLAGIPGSWALEWTNPDDMPDQERINLLALLAAYPNDAVGQITFTMGVETGMTPGQGFLCGISPGAISVEFEAVPNTPVVIDGVSLGEFEAYAYDPANSNWGILVGSVIVTAGSSQAVIVSADIPFPAEIPCGPHSP